MFMATNYTIMDILRSITTTKDEMKVSIGTDNDNITDFSYLIHNAKIDFYNNGLIYGYEKVWKDIYGNDVLIPGPYPTEIGGKVDVPGEEVEWDGTYEGLIDIMEIVLDARLDMKSELGTSSDVFSTYPYTLETLLSSIYSDAFDDGQNLGVSQVMVPPVIHSSNGIVEITTSVPNVRIRYTIDDGQPITYTGQFTTQEEITVTAWIEGGENWEYKSPEVSALITLVTPDAPVISFYMNVITITGQGTIYYSFDNINFNVYTGPIEIFSDGTIYSYCVWGNLASLVSSLEYGYLWPIGDDYLSFDVVQGGNLYVKATQTPNYSGTRTEYEFEYRINNGSWTRKTFSETSGQSMYISLSAGDYIQFKSIYGYYDGPQFCGQGYKNNFESHSDLQNTLIVNVSGNVMSLFYDDVYSKTLSSNEDYFKSLFEGLLIVDGSDLEIPATTLFTSCYSRMFAYSEIQELPTLPATTLANGCYSSMFEGCKATDLSNYTLLATTLSTGCYTQMFSHSRQLVLPPVLPATTLANGCYDMMFYMCSSLTTAPVLPATTLIHNCYDNMFAKCYSLVNAPVLSSTTLANGCYNGMFKECTSLVSAPVLPANELYEDCYKEMFKGCESLNYIKALFTSRLETQSGYPYTEQWVQGVASNGIFEKNPNYIGLGHRDNSQAPQNWTIIDAA